MKQLSLGQIAKEGSANGYFTEVLANNLKGICKDKGECFQDMYLGVIEGVLAKSLKTQ